MINQTRLRLLAAGVSMIALGAVAPLVAQTVPGVTQITSLPTVDATYTIDLLTGLNSGVTDAVPASTATAAVTNVATGAVSQIGTASLDTANITLINDGVANISAIADAVNLAGAATATAGVDFGVEQDVTAPDLATANLINNNSLNIVADAAADGSTTATSTADVLGITQTATGTAIGSDAAVSLVNNSAGVIDVSADALATGVTTATATSDVTGMTQLATGTGLGSDAAVELVNNANAAINVSANAQATAGTSTATADALGVTQLSVGDTVLSTFNNNGAFTVNANAIADGVTTGTATADATGYEVTGAPVNLAVTNAKTFAVAANAAATGSVSNTTVANATGMRFEALGDVLGGTIVNDGTLYVDATAQNNANAVGIEMDSAANAATLTNTGTIRATAITTDGLAGATATGLVVRNNATPSLTDVFTLNNNGGSFIARQSDDGGVTFTRGMAIDTSLAPNQAVINLLGAGSIYGNVDIAANDAINVSAGETRLDGIVNPTGPLDGSLTIASGGTLYLVDQPSANPSYDGAAGVNVDTFTVAPGGTLALQLATSPVPATALLDYPTVVANTANLAGTLLVRPTSSNGLYGNSYVYDNVIDADTRVGTFSNVVTSTGSPLLRANAVYDADANVDVSLTRVAFGGVAGLTRNETAVGNGIEGTYSSGLTGPYGNLVGNLFAQNAANYPGALDQLSGAQYAGYVQGLRNYSMQTNTLVSDQIDCAISVRGMDQCRDPESRVRLWGLGGYNDVKVDPDINAPGYKSKNWFALLGVDYTTGNFTLGGFGGYRKTKMAFDRYNGRIKADGWQLGLLAAYDIGSVYLRGVGSYSDLGGDSRRDLSIGTTSGMISGKPDARLWSFYGEGGARIGLGGSWLTPFVGVDYTTVKLKSFTETGVPGANLALRSQSDNQTALLAGVKWAANFGGLIPEAKVAYRHDFGSRVYGVDASFADAPVGTNFRVYSPETKRGSIVAGLSLAAAVSDQLTGRIGYQGRFNSDVRDHAFYGSLTLALGASAPAAPPPPPPPPPMSIAPPPPPPPAVVECQSGPYIVFFDFDRSDITPEAASILDNALVNYGNCGKATVVLAGHADKSGSNEYNQALSERRNSAVRGYITSRGVPDGVISSQAFGETRPLVDTADGVKEPQNRRVEIQYGPGSGN